MYKITYLGPRGTFSEEAYLKLSALFRVPRLDEGEEVLAQKNEEVVPLVVEHGGYGALAVGTKAGGRIDGPTATFVHLLEDFSTTKDCPIDILGGLDMSLSFVLMGRKGVKKDQIKTLVSHARSFGACKKLVQRLISNGAVVLESDSNGRAALDVATKSNLTFAAALGSRVAAEKYGLEVLEETCEDNPAETTFFMLAPRTRTIKTGNRAVLVFRIKDKPLALVDVLLPLGRAGFNLRQVHSCHTQDGKYDFYAEIECGENETRELSQAVRKASQHMTRHIMLGPFRVVKC